MIIRHEAIISHARLLFSESPNLITWTRFICQMLFGGVENCTLSVVFISLSVCLSICLSLYIRKYICLDIVYVFLWNVNASSHVCINVYIMSTRTEQLCSYFTHCLAGKYVSVGWWAFKLSKLSLSCWRYRHFPLRNQALQGWPKERRHFSWKRFIFYISSDTDRLFMCRRFLSKDVNWYDIL